MSSLHHALMWAFLLQPPVPSEIAEPGVRWADPLTYRDYAVQAWNQWRRHEALEMFSSILQDAPLGPGGGWFHGSTCKHDWKTFTTSLGLAGERSIKRKQFPGPIEWFDRLDRNRDGQLTPEDFDHDRPPAFNPMQFGMMLMRTMDTDGDGEVSPAEWEAFFKSATSGKDNMAMMDLMGALRSAMARMMNSDGPPPSMVAAGVLSGDLGSICEGPRVGQRGLDFRLKTQDGKRTITLSEYRGKKPVVLVFGSFS